MDEGITPLAEALMTEKYDNVALLLEAKADPGFKNLQGLQIALTHRHIPTCRLLLKFGANPFLLWNDLSLLGWAMIKGHDWSNRLERTRILLKWDLGVSALVDEKKIQTFLKTHADQELTLPLEDQDSTKFIAIYQMQSLLTHSKNALFLQVYKYLVEALRVKVLADPILSFL
jgi:ankyrin repeat protein